jgi:hypothetical protein
MSPHSRLAASKLPVVAVLHTALAALRGHQTDEAVRSRFRSRFPAEVGFWVRVGLDGVWGLARLLRR